MTSLKSYHHQNAKNIFKTNPKATSQANPEINLETNPEIISEIINTPLGPIMILASDGYLAGVHAPSSSQMRTRPSKKKLRTAKLNKKLRDKNLRNKKTVKRSANLRVIAKTKKELLEYFSGSRKKWSVRYRNLKGTPFQKMVWAEMQKIPYGRTLSYGDIAKKIGRPFASRAVGNACNKNAYLIIIPCHRVVASNGQLGGFALGLRTKQTLLDIEAKH